MKRSRGKVAFRGLIGSALLMPVLFFGGNPSAAIPIIEIREEVIDLQKYQAEAPYKIIEVLEKKMAGKKLSGKTREKLFTLPQDQTQLMISLCERISPDQHSAGADIAYLLVLALILLS